MIRIASTKTDRTPYSPTPEQIATAAAEIRAGWSEDERRRRRVGGPQTAPWSPPEIVVDADCEIP